MNIIMKSIVCVTVCLGFYAPSQMVRADSVTGVDVAVQLGDYNGIQFDPDFSFSSSCRMRRMPEIQVLTADFLAALTGVALPSSAKSRQTTGAAIVISDAQEAAAKAGGYSLSKIAETASQVKADKEKLYELLGKMLDDRYRVNPLLIGPALKQASEERRSLQDFVRELMKVPDAKLNGKIAIAMDAVADGTDDRLADLEKIIPILSELGRKFNASAAY